MSLLDYCFYVQRYDGSGNQCIHKTRVEKPFLRKSEEMYGITPVHVEHILTMPNHIHGFINGLRCFLVTSHQIFL